MVNYQVVIDAVVVPIVGTMIPVKRNWFWASRQRNQYNFRSTELIFRVIMVSFTTTTTVELSIWIGKGAWCQTVSIIVWRIGIIYLAVLKRAQSSASADDDMTIFIIWAVVKIGPFQCGTGSSPARNMWDPDQLQPLDSLWNPSL